MDDQARNRYYTAEEAAKMLGVFIDNFFRMKLRYELVDHKQMYSQSLIDSIASSWSEILCQKCREHNYYGNLEQELVEARKENNKLSLVNMNLESQRTRMLEQLRESDERYRSTADLRDDLNQVKSSNYYLRSELKKCRDSTSASDVTPDVTFSESEADKALITELQQQIEVITNELNELRETDKNKDEKIERLSAEVQLLEEIRNLLEGN